MLSDQLLLSAQHVVVGLLWTRVQKWKHLSTTGCPRLWRQGSQQTIGWVMTVRWLTWKYYAASCAWRTDQAKPNVWRGKSWWFSRFSLVSCVHSGLVAGHQMKPIRAQCGLQSGPSQCVEWCTSWPTWNIDILSQNAVSRAQFFQIQAIQTAHTLIIYRQTSD